MPQSNKPTSCPASQTFPCQAWGSGHSQRGLPRPLSTTPCCMACSQQSFLLSGWQVMLQDGRPHHDLMWGVWCISNSATDYAAEHEKTGYFLQWKQPGKERLILNNKVMTEKSDYEHYFHLDNWFPAYTTLWVFHPQTLHFQKLSVEHSLVDAAGHWTRNSPSRTWFLNQNYTKTDTMNAPVLPSYAQKNTEVPMGSSNYFFFSNQPTR